MDLFGNTSNTAPTAVDCNGRQIQVNSVVEYIGELASQYAYTDGRAMANVERINGGVYTIKLYKDGKLHRIKVTARDIKLF